MIIGNFTVKEDIPIVYVNARSFPEGIDEAHQKLHTIVGSPNGSRRYFGISRPEEGNDGGIVYRAGASEIEPGESERLNLPKIILKKGEYASILINDYQSNVTQISRAFEELMKHPDLDLDGYCVEWYLKSDVRCMIRLTT